MNKKQVTCSALAAMMFAGTTGFTAFAAMPDATVLIKDKAYALDYAENTANRAEIIKQLGQLTEGEQAILKLNNKWLNNDKTAADTTKIPAVTYKDADGKETKYEAQDGVAVEEGDFKVVEISAVGAKKLQVNFNKAVEDTSKVTYSIKRDGATVGIVADSAVWNEDKTQVTLTTSYNLMTGNYVATAKYADGEETKAEAKIEAAKLTTIELADNAVYQYVMKDGKPTSQIDMNTVAVGVKFLNQYGEDVKVSGGLTISPNYGRAEYAVKEGKIYLGMNNDNPIGFRVGDKIPVTVIYNEGTNVVTETHEVVVSEAQKVASVEVGTITTDKKDYKDKDVFVGNITKAEYYLPIVAKDQYGNDILDVKNLPGAQAILSNPGLTAEITTKNDKPVIAIARALDEKGEEKEIKVVGETVITLIAGGQSTTAKFELKNDVALANLRFNQPDDVLRRGGEAKISFSAVDQYGNDLKKASDLKLSGDSVEDDYTTSLELKGVFNNIANQDVVINVSGGEIKAGTDWKNDGARTFTVKAYKDSAQVIVTVIAGTNPQTLTISTVQGSKEAAITDVKIKDGYKKAEIGAVVKVEGKIRDQYDTVITGKTPVYEVKSGNAKIVSGKTDEFEITGEGKVVIEATYTTGTGNDKITLDSREIVINGVKTDSIEKYDVKLNKETIYVGSDRIDTAKNADSNHDIKATLLGYIGEDKVKLASSGINAADKYELKTNSKYVTTDSSVGIVLKEGQTIADTVEETGTLLVEKEGQIISKAIKISNKARKEQALAIYYGDKVTEDKTTTDYITKDKAFKNVAGYVEDQYGVEMPVNVKYQLVNKDGTTTVIPNLDNVIAGNKVVVNYITNEGQTAKITVVITEVKTN